MKNDKHCPNKTPSSSESISVSEVLYQLSSLRKVRTIKKKRKTPRAYPGGPKRAKLPPLNVKVRLERR